MVRRHTDCACGGAFGKFWLTGRVRDYGDAPVAFVLKGTRGLIGSGRLSTWFGHPVFWANEQQLGWRLGIE